VIFFRYLKTVQKTTDVISALFAFIVCQCSLKVAHRDPNLVSSFPYVWSAVLPAFFVVLFKIMFKNNNNNNNNNNSYCCCRMVTLMFEPTLAVFGHCT